MKKNASARALKWPLILLIQFLAMLALGALTALSLFLGGSIHKLCVWGLFPLCLHSHAPWAFELRGMARAARGGVCLPRADLGLFARGGAGFPLRLFVACGRGGRRSPQAADAKVKEQAWKKI